jgi:hypothetical protein
MTRMGLMRGDLFLRKVALWKASDRLHPGIAARSFELAVAE